MKKTILWFSAVSLLFGFFGLAWAGVLTSNGFFYKPGLGARGEQEKGSYDSGLDRVDARLAKEIWVGDPNYGTTPQDAITAIGSTACILRVPKGTHHVSVDLTVPANITLKPEHGAIFSVATTKTLAINGPIEAGARKLFTIAGTGKVRISNGGWVRASWFADSGSGTNNDPWIITLQKAVDAVKTYQTGLLIDKGFFQVSAVTELTETDKTWNTSIVAESPLNSTIKLADGANCPIFRNSIYVQANWTLDGIFFDGNKANQTVAHPLIDLYQFYSTYITRCVFSHSKGAGVKLTADTAHGAGISGFSNITLEKNAFYSNDGDGLHIYYDSPSANVTALNINVKDSIIDRNAGWGVKIENASYATPASIDRTGRVSVSSIHFEHNVLGDVLVSGWQGVNVYNSGHQSYNGVLASIKYVNGARGGSVRDNKQNNTGNHVYSGFYFLYLDKTTRDVSYGSNELRVHSGYGAALNFAAKIYDAGANKCFDAQPNVVRPPNHPTSLTALSGVLPSGLDLPTNYLLYSEDLTQAAWVKAGGATVAQQSSLFGGPPGYIIPYSSITIPTPATDYIYQDVNLAVKAGEVLTFSGFIYEVGHTSLHSVVRLKVGDAAGAWSYQEDAHITYIPVLGSYYDYHFKRFYITTVAQTDISTVRVEIREPYVSTLGVWGMQLNKGGLLPYIPTAAAPATRYPGYQTNKLYASGGISAGYKTDASSSGVLNIHAYKGKYHTVTLTENITTVNIANSGAAGDELVVRFTQGGSGGYTVTGWGTTKLIGGTYTPTAAVGASDCLTFFYDGTAWIETARAMNVK
ncbi:MAG: right-handed parallel beta-helix repeat-containing protein [Deltaproteobacteria bacterium]|nr:right-handed parallel beta-helix repeat-containing protein [Deltaproteobacteria bacterium]